MILEGITADNFPLRIEDLVLAALVMQNPKERARIFTDIMETARACGVAEQAEETAQSIAKREGEPELWELPDTFDKPIVLQGFPLSALPAVLQEFLQAVSEHIQVYPEMGALPLLSVLSLCVMGKCEIRFPESDHTEPLNLYTMTIAAPGERKSGSFKEFMRPVDDYVERYNAMNSDRVHQNKAERAFLERQRSAAMGGRHPDLDKVKALTRQLHEMEELHELRLNAKDVTPEALAWELHKQHERLAILDDEGSIFDVLSGLYSNGQSNINIFLEAYDGSPYSVLRRTKESITLYNPLLTMGLMVQPSHFDEAMNNRQFSGRGFIYRFLFSFPESKAGYQKFFNGNIHTRISNNYVNLVNRLLNIPYPERGEEMPLVQTDHDANSVLEQYFYHIQEGMRPGGIFEHLKEWAAKQFAKCMKIAAILHLCEYGIDDRINEQTALNAVNIAMWTENHALKALSGDMTDTQEEKDAKYILSKLKQSDKDVITKRELLRMCRALSAEEAEKPLEILEDMKCIKRNIVKTGKQGKPKEIIKINPLIF